MMGMTITRFEKTIIPQTLEGQKFADEYEKRLTEQGAFRGRAEDSLSIVIKAQYYLTFTEEVDNGNDD
jgi:hypothetical protein